MPLNGRYSTIDKAIMVTTGNTLVLCGDTSALSVNTSDMITPAGGTTRDYSLAGSSAKIEILSNSKVLYAELVWLSTVKSTIDGAVDVRSIQSNPISFTTPSGTISLAPEFIDSYISPTGTVDCLRATNVTNIISNSLSGDYTVSNIPTSIPQDGLSEVRCGWCLTVVYRNNSFKPKRIVYALGIEAATALAPIQSTFTGFKTDSDQSLLKGDLLVVFANGNPLDGNDTLKIGSSFASLTTVGNPIGIPNSNPGTSPNNPWNSFSSGQINIANTLSINKGLIDISGTKGTINHNAFIPTQVLGARNKWDITAIDISNTLVVNQTQLAGQYTLSDSTNSIELVAFGSQIDSEAPDLVATLTSFDVDGDNEYNIQVGEYVVYVVQIKNTGKTAANNVTLSTTLNPAIQFVPNSVTINGVTQTGANITQSINIGSIEAGGLTNVGFTIKAIALVPDGTTANTIVNYNYSFTSGTGSPTYINYADTNSLNLIIQTGSLSIVKSMSVNSVKLGDTIVYSTEITNTGSENAYNIFFQDKINKYCSFVLGTISIDNVPHTDFNPNNGFALDNLLPKAKTTISFSVKVNTLSPNTVVQNGALVTFSYIFNQYIVPVTKTVLSNTTSIQIEFNDLVAKRTASNYYPNVSDTVTLTLALTNIGNINNTNVNVIEPPIPGTTFVDGSVYVNGIRKLGYNPFTGFTLDSIDAKTTTVITYDVLIIQIQPNQIIENIAQVPFKYQISTESPVISTEKISNKVTTRTNFVVIDIPETVDKNYSIIGETLYYSVNITNNGNIDAINTTFLSAIQPETSFIPDTVSINGVPKPGYNPNLGFSVNTLPPDNTVNVTFNALVNSIPTPNIVYNSSELVYSYKPDPNGAPITDTLTSNTVNTIINKASFSITKSVDKAYATIGEYLVYKCILSNTGTVDLTNVHFNDEISTYLKFTTGTVFVNGVNYPDYNPNNSFPIGTIKPNEIIEVIFATEILVAPPFGYIVNLGEMTYTYKLDPTSPIITESKKSNAVQTKVVYGNLSLTKYASLSYSTIGNVISYSFEISNTGNVSLNNIFFFDEIPTGSTFVSESVFINGISKTDYNPITGFDIGILNVGQVSTVTFNVTVTSMPVPNTLTNYGSANYSYIINPQMPPFSKTSNSNSVTTIVNMSSLTFTKVVDKNYASINDLLTYTITAHNTGTVVLENLSFTDLIPAGSTFLAGSVIIDNISYINYNPNNSFSLPNILPGESRVISFKTTVTSLPSPPKLDNHAHVTYKYKLNPVGEYYSNSLTSNTVTTNITQNLLSNTKTVSKLYATVLDTLTYTSTITNSGNINFTDTNFVDILAPELSFVPGSVTINGISQGSYDPILGFTLGTILPSDVITVVFNVTVISIPSNGLVNNSSNIYYKYKLSPDTPEILSNKNSNTVTTAIKSGIITVEKISNRTTARLTDTIEYSFILTNTGNTTLNNLLFQDTIQSESTFNPNTVYVNNVNFTNYNPSTGFAIDDLQVGKFATVSFTVTVNSIPSNSKLLNTGNINYSYYINPEQAPVVKNKLSNETSVNISDSIITATKSVNKSIAKLGSVIDFTVDIVNSGNVSAEFVNFTDLLSENLSFNDGTVIINGQSEPTFNPNTGFAINDIVAQTTTTVSFSATIISRPSDNIIRNFATIDYKYRLSINDPYIDASIATNTTTTLVAVAELTLNKNVDKLYATVGNLINYTVKVTNTGSVNATNLIFKDLTPSNTSFISDSVVIDGISTPSLNPNTGFALTDLIPLQFHTVSFNIIVNTLPTSGIIENIGTATFDYKLIPTDNTETKTNSSNKVTTNINIGNLILTKTVNSNYSTIGDTLSYSVTIENKGSVDCTNIFFQDIIQTEGTFVAESVKINNAPMPLLNPITGFTLSPISKAAITVVTFDVLVNSLPVSSTIDNNATSNYKYIINPSNEPISTSSTSNTVSTTINVSSLSITKVTNKSFATIDDTISYSIDIINTGNINASFVNFRDIIPNGLTFVKDSVTINGESKINFDPYQSFTLGTLIPGSSTIVTFDAKVTAIPSPSLVTNIANIVYSYKINPSTDYIVTQTNSNAVTTQINLGKITVTKAVDKTHATINDILTYTIEVNNTGNIDATNVIFTDGLQLESSFVDGSVTVNGESKVLYNPTTGFNLGTIAPLNKSTITFKVTVNSLPLQYSIINEATGTFSYKINPSGETYTKSEKSNAISTIIIVAGLSATKVVNLSYATINDILEYSITVKNTGNTTNSSLFFIDTLSVGATFEAGTVTINGIEEANLNPITGFNIPNLLSGNTVVVAFKVKVTSVPPSQFVTNFVDVNGVYKINPSGADYQVSATSNTVSTQINIGNLTNVKSVDKQYSKVGDTITYTNTISNVGNVTAQSVQFFDTLQPEVQFISGTVRINSVLYPSLDPTIGFSLGDLIKDSVVTVSFDIKINTLPVPPEVVNKSHAQFSYKISPTGNLIVKTIFSNTVITNVVKGEIYVTKVVDKPIATIGDSLTFIISLTNVGNVTASELWFQDTPSTGASFIAGSVIVNGVSKPTFSPTSGFALDNLGIGNVTTIEFAATVTSLPPTNKVTNQAVLNFKFVVDPKEQPFTTTTYSNTTTTNIALGNLNVVKAVDKQFATIAEKLTYTIVITNIGNIDTTNVVFLDPTPLNSLFVVGSVKVNGVSHLTYNPSVGFNLDTMKPGEIITVVYQVEVI